MLDRTVIARSFRHSGGMLREFLITNRRDVIRTSCEKSLARFAPAGTPEVLEHGIPLFIQQLIDALAIRPSAHARDGNTAEQIPFPPEIGRSAALHGADLLRRGFSINLVVHYYGDVCQTVTELAIEMHCPIDADDFRILNGCLDNAIAGAVTAFAQGHQDASDDREDERYERLSVQRQEHRRLVEIAIQAFTAIKSGSLGMAGPTAALLMHALTELELLSEPQVADGDAFEAAASRRHASRH